MVENSGLKQQVPKAKTNRVTEASGTPNILPSCSRPQTSQDSGRLNRSSTLSQQQASILHPFKFEPRQTKTRPDTGRTTFNNSVANHHLGLQLQQQQGTTTNTTTKQRMIS